MALITWILLLTVIFVIIAYFVGQKRCKMTTLSISSPQNVSSRTTSVGTLSIVNAGSHFLGHYPHRTLMKLGELYGKIFCVKLANDRLMVVINDHKLMKEMMANSKFSLTTNSPALNFMAGAIQNSDPAKCDEILNPHRRFFLHHLKLFQNSIDSIVDQEILELLDTLRGQMGQPIVDLRQTISLSILSALAKILGLQKYSEDGDPTLPNVLRNLIKMSTPLSRSKDAKGFDLFLTPETRVEKNSEKNFKRNHTEFEHGCADFHHFLKYQIEQHDVSPLDENNPRDFIDAFLIENKRHQKNSNQPANFSQSEKEEVEGQLILTLTDILLGAIEPTAISILWVILYLSHHEDIQRELQTEIDDAIGRHNLPTMDARKCMPLTIAIMMESLRLSSIFPLGPSFHIAAEGAHLHGHLIPKDTVICSNYWAAHHNPAVWGDPENFRPHRFISVHGDSMGTGEKILKRHEASIPFGHGKRSCLGELLAKQFLFIFVTAVFQKFTIKLHAPETTTLVPSPGRLLTPQKFEVVLRERP